MTKEIKDITTILDEALPTMDIKGNSYVMVKDRIRAFNRWYPKGAIVTEPIDMPDGKTIRFKALVWPDGVGGNNRYFVGHSEATRGMAGIAGASPCEVCETSSVGRALAMMGIGVIDSVASGDEIRKAAPERSVFEVAREFIASTTDKDVLKQAIDRVDQTVELTTAEKHQLNKLIAARMNQ